MTPRGGAPLIATRKRGQRPAGSVWVNYGDFVEPDWWRWSNTTDTPELLVRPGDPIVRLDLRCLIDLDLVLFAAAWSDPVSHLYERLQEYAREILIQVVAFEGDIGWWWLRDVGRIEFGERHLVKSGDRRAA